MKALQRRTAPYIYIYIYRAKAELIRAKQLPKALYGCETAPANESALKTLQTRIMDTLTFTTARRSVGLTFAAFEGVDKECKKLLGDVPEGVTASKIRDITSKCEADWIARDVIQ